MDHKKIYRAGVIPYYLNEEGEPVMMFMLPSDPNYGGDKLQISKGKIEDNETEAVAAIREGEEELGLKQTNIINIDELGVYLGRTTFFIAQINSPDDFNDPLYETGAVAWMTKDEFIACGRKIHKQIVKDAYERIKNGS